jgi:hypothetical protein
MRSCLLFVIPAMLCAADLKIDHATVAGHDLKKMQAALEAVGIPTVYGGPHANGVTEMALASFPDGSYLEAIAVQPNADPKALEKHEWAQFLKGDAMPCGWAVQTKDVAAERRRLQAAGVAVSEPVRAGRRRPDGVRLDWETADLGSATRGSFFPFLIHDFTPREQRAFPQGKPTTRDFQAVTRVVIAVRNLDAAIEQYRKAFDMPPAIKQVDQEFGAQLAIVGSSPVVLAQPLHVGTWLDDRIQKFGEGPCAFILGATRPGRYKAASKSRWFATDISWFDAEKLGWRLGYEASQGR